MILPTKHVRTDRALVGVGAELLHLLREPMTISRLWNEFRARRSLGSPRAPIDYHWFILSLDFLFMIGAVQIIRGVLERSES